MAEKKGFTGQLIYEFPTERLLEIELNSGRWCRVTCDTFRSYGGPRRIDGKTYNGPCYYQHTNKLAECDDERPWKLKTTEESNIQVKSTRRIKRAFL